MQIETEPLPIEGLKFNISLVAPATSENIDFYRSMSLEYGYAAQVEVKYEGDENNKKNGFNFYHLDFNPIPVCRQNRAFFVPDYSRLKQVGFFPPFSRLEEDVLTRLIGQINQEVIKGELLKLLEQGKPASYSVPLALPGIVSNRGAASPGGFVKVWRKGPWTRWRTRPQD